jgi:universal stress protein A
MAHLKNILVAVDFSEISSAALAYGRELARSFGGALTIIHIVNVVVSGIGEAGGRFLEAQEKAEAAARTQVEALLTAEDRSGHAKAAVLSSIEPAQAIVAYADQTGVDLIVTGTHGHRGVRHLLLGSVAEGVIRAARCPVLVVKGAKVSQRRDVSSRT